MKPGTIVFQGISKKGTTYTLRYPTVDDVGDLTQYINTISDEHTYITFQGEHLSTEYEQQYLETIIKKIHEHKAIKLFATVDNHIVGVADIVMQERVLSHEGVLGISLAQQYRGEGIGSQLLDTIITEAEEHIDSLKIITLGVFANNPLAISLYESRGFKESGRVPKGILHRGLYIDHIYMYKFVGEFASQ